MNIAFSLEYTIFIKNWLGINSSEINSLEISAELRIEVSKHRKNKPIIAIDDKLMILRVYNLQNV